MHDNNIIIISTMRIHARVLNNTNSDTTDAVNVLWVRFTAVATRMLEMTFIPRARFSSAQPVDQTSGRRERITFSAVTH